MSEDEAAVVLKSVRLHTDGSCHGNPGPGGWGVVLEYDGRERELNGAERATTNNRMELTAVIEGLRALRESCRVEIVTDSKYVIEGMKSWIHGWKRNGWRTAGRQPVRNVELWQALDVEAARHQVRWTWVRGHTGNPGNERADRLANAAVEQLSRR